MGTGTELQFKQLIDRILQMKEQGATRAEIRAAYGGLAGDEKAHIGLIVRQEWQRRQGWRVYFAKFPKCGLIKIGISRDVPERLNALSRMKGEPAELLLDFPGMFPLDEGWYHACFHEWRVAGEWFALTEASLAKVSEIAIAGPAVRLEAA